MTYLMQIVNVVELSIARRLGIVPINKIRLQYPTRYLSLGCYSMAGRNNAGIERSGDGSPKETPRSRSKSSLTFVSRTNLVTGKMDWVVQDKNYDYLQEIARSGYGDMLHDTDRNEKYYKAIIQAVKLLKAQGKQVKALDIGTGTGLLSMMAAEAGADILTACEAFPPVANCAEKVLEANGFKNKIKLIHKRSTEVSLADLGERANLLVTELFDTELIGEGAIGSYSDAHDRLMEEDCVAVPTSAVMYVQAVHSDILGKWNSLQPVMLPNGKIISSPKSFTHCTGAPSLHDIQIDELQDHLQFISPPVEVFRFDFSRRNALRKEEASLWTTTALQDGTVDAFVMWWDLVMDPQGEIILSCAPCWTRVQGQPVPWRDHWMQALYYPSSSLMVRKGDTFDIHSSHDEYSLWFDTSKMPSQRPVCECGLHVALSRSRLGQINDKARNQILITALEKHVTQTTVCLVISDGSLLPLYAACLGAKKVFYLDNSWSSRNIVRELIEHNGLQSQVTVLDKNAEDITSEDLGNLKIDMVIAEPFFQAAHLPWEHMYFWYAVNSLHPNLSPDVVILPRTMTIKAMAVQFRDLHKIRAPVENCEGFDISEFDRLIESSSESADEEIEPQPLWEYPAMALSPPKPITTVDFSQPPDALAQSQSRIQLQCCQQGTLNGVVMWTEYQFGENLSISTGLANDEWNGGRLRWDMYSRQGVKLFRHGRKVKENLEVDITIQFSPEAGDFTFHIQTMEAKSAV